MTLTLDHAAPAVGAVVDLPVASLVGDNYRPEDASAVRQLAAAIAADGRVHTPIRVAPMGDGRYIIIGGHHRTAAVRLLGWETIPATVEPAMGERDRLRARMADNVTHRASSPAEDAAEIGRLLDLGETVETLAVAFAKSVAWVENRRELLQLAPEIRGAIAARGFVWARPLYGLPDGAQLALVARLDDDTTRGQWSRTCQLAREAEAERAAASMFDAASYTLTAEQWTTAAAAYVDAAAAEDVPAPAPAPVREQVLGLVDIAERFGVAHTTAHKWQARGLLPAADMYVSRAPAWFAGTIDQWARETGRA